MRHVMPARKALAVRTIFNLLGPLSNPAGAGRLVVGVYSPALIDPFARALAAMGVKRALVVGGDGVDEIALDGETAAARLRDGEIERFSIRPADWGATPAPLAAVRVDSPAESKQMLLAALAGENPVARDFAAVNAGALLTVADIAPDLKAGFDLARATIASGARARQSRFVSRRHRARPLSRRCSKKSSPAKKRGSSKTSAKRRRWSSSPPPKKPRRRAIFCAR